MRREMKEKEGKGRIKDRERGGMIDFLTLDSV